MHNSFEAKVRLLHNETIEAFTDIMYLIIGETLDGDHQRSFIFCHLFIIDFIYSISFRRVMKQAAKKYNKPITIPAAN